MKKPKGTQLTFLPTNNPLLVPEYLVEQLKDRDFEVEDFYKFAILMMRNPFCIFGIFANKENDVKGFMMATVNPLGKWLNVPYLSIDKEYQNRGCINECLGILKKVVIGNGLKGIKMTTSRPKAFEKYGFEKAELTNMRFTYGRNS